MNVAPAPHGTGSGPAATGRVLKVIVVPGAKPQNALVPTTGPPRGVMVAPLESKYSMAMSMFTPVTSFEVQVIEVSTKAAFRQPPAIALPSPETSRTASAFL
jgi:hypothetical protein